MTYRIKAARYANVEHTSAVIRTKEAGDVAISEKDTPEEWAAMLERGDVKPYQPPAEPKKGKAQ